MTLARVRRNKVTTTVARPSGLRFLFFFVSLIGALRTPGEDDIGAVRNLGEPASTQRQH